MNLYWLGLVLAIAGVGWLIRWLRARRTIGHLILHGQPWMTIARGTVVRMSSGESFITKRAARTDLTGATEIVPVRKG